MRIITTVHFSKQIKTFAKKYRRASSDVTRTLHTFSKEKSQYLGAKLYKIRVKSSDMTQGKSGGFRLIVLCVEIIDHLVPITIYQKAVQEDMSERELEYHLACVRAELTYR